jgi:hypothetical protein
MNNPQVRLIHIREQSASASSPCQQARKQSVHIRGNDAASIGHDPAVATDTDTPQTDRDSELVAATVAPLTGIEREPDTAENYPIRRIAGDNSPPIGFPVHIRHISPYVLL